MKYYIIIMAAVVLGQTFLACVLSWIYQKKNDDIDYFQAISIYFKKEVGSFFVIISFTALLMFVLSDWMNLSTTKEMLLSIEKRSRFEEAQLRFRTVAVFYGVFAQWFAFLFYKGGVNAILKYKSDKGI